MQSAKASEDTIFHKIIRREIPAPLLVDDEHVVAFRDVNPQAPTHILIVPKKTIPSLREAGPEDKELIGHMLLTAARLAKSEGISEGGYRTVFNAGSDGGQSVPQLHLHLLGGRCMEWPPG